MNKNLKIPPRITVRDGKSLECFLHEIGHIPLLKAEEEVKLAKAVKKGSKESEDKLITANLRFVVSVAKQYQNQGILLSDLVNTGILGLIKSIKKYDHTRGFKLISYAVWWIKQSIIAHIGKRSTVVARPQNKIQAINKIRKIKKELAQKNERFPTIEEISEELNISSKEIRGNLQISNRHSSLNAPFIEGEDNTLLDILEDDLAEAPDESLIKDSLKKEIQKILSELNQRESKIIRWYFGINRDHPMTLDEIGEKLNLTRERVRQIKEKSLSKLHDKSHHRNLGRYC